MQVPLLPTDRFVKYCKDRDVQIDAMRLSRLEKLRIFAPIVRFIDHGSFSERLRFPGSIVADWFEAGQAVDSYDFHKSFQSPPAELESEAFYSIFQLDDLASTQGLLSLTIALDQYLDEPPSDQQAAKNVGRWLEHARRVQEGIQGSDFRRALPILCQYLANRYYPQTQTNGRMISVPKTSSMGSWLDVQGLDWDWRTYSREFDPSGVENTFSLDRSILKHAYGAMAASGYFCDPLENWADLVGFVSVSEKRRLKGKALRAQSHYDAAQLLRFLYKDLYGEDLRPPAEQGRVIITPFPEYAVRDDARRHMEFVVNRYDLNPQPKLVLFVEGESEIVIVNTLLNKLFGVAVGSYAIELVNLRGVNNATGNKKQDRFSAIILLVDYLNHHQSISYLILDRENNSEKLKDAAKSRESLHGQPRLAVPWQHIHLWRVSLEFDNFSDTELAKALSDEAGSRAHFTQIELLAARTSVNPGKSLSNLFFEKAGRGLNKPSLARRLAAVILDPKSRRRPGGRPIVARLKRVLELASLNPFPTREENWARNQTSVILGGNKRKL